MSFPAISADSLYRCGFASLAFTLNHHRLRPGVLLCLGLLRTPPTLLTLLSLLALLVHPTPLRSSSVRTTGSASSTSRHARFTERLSPASSPETAPCARTLPTTSSQRTPRPASLGPCSASAGHTPALSSSSSVSSMVGHLSLQLLPSPRSLQIGASEHGCLFWAQEGTGGCVRACLQSWILCLELCLTVDQFELGCTITTAGRLRDCVSDLASPWLCLRWGALSRRGP